MEPSTSYKAKKQPVVGDVQGSGAAGEDEEKQKQKSDIPRRTGQSQVYTATRDTLFSKKISDAEPHALVRIFLCYISVFLHLFLTLF